jgi:thiamine-monophosphate kinase
MEQRTELNSLGEFALIKHLTQHFIPQHESTIKGVGDDAAIIATGGVYDQVVTTDLLVEGVHFDLMYTPLKHLGYKSIAVNVSDVCAMNATPKYITVSFAVSNRFSLEAMEELYSGMQLACEKYGVDLIGGDTSAAPHGLTISITAIGEVLPEKIATRDGAKLNDLVVVSGDLGGAYLGLQVLEREKEVFKSTPSIQPDLSGFDYLLQRQLKPEARIDAIQYLADLKIQPTAMIDVSDGLSSDLMHIAKQSMLGCDIYENKIPLAPDTIRVAADFGLDPLTCALNGGEDYELLFTIAQSEYEKIKGSPHFTIIGHMTEESTGCRLITKSNEALELKAQGWQSFTKE